MIAARGYAGRRVGVLGLGRSGLATATALAAGDAEAICWDENETARDQAATRGWTIADLTRPQAWDDIAALIVSPGIAHLYPAPHPAIALAWDRGVPVDNDIGLFFRSVVTETWEDMERSPRIVCVTGSNGKSTTATLTAHILKQTGRKVQLGGNIGRGVLDLDPPPDGAFIVLELSSYQIDLARTLRPDIGVLLNLSPDHYDRHGGEGGYFAAKRRLFEIGAPERAIIGVDETEGRFLANQIQTGPEGVQLIRLATKRQLKGRDWSVFARKGFLVEWRAERQIHAIDLRTHPNLPGLHNQQNACAAYAVCRALGIAPRPIEAGIATFGGLAHRMERLGEINGVLYVNDSKATNTDAAARALDHYDRIHWIAGGKPKAGGIAALSPWFDKIAMAYLIGEGAQEFARTLGPVPHVLSHDLETAITQAHANAKPGEIVLLSPAAASFDQFASFEARGDAFRAMIRALAEKCP